MQTKGKYTDCWKYRVGWVNKSNVYCWRDSEWDVPAFFPLSSLFFLSSLLKTCKIIASFGGQVSSRISSPKLISGYEFNLVFRLYTKRWGEYHFWPIGLLVHWTRSTQNLYINVCVWFTLQKILAVKDSFHHDLLNILKGKSVPLQAWSGPEGSRKLRFPYFKKTAQDGGKVVGLTHRPPLPPGNTPGTHFC